MPQRPAWPEAAFRAPELAEAQGEHAPGPWSDLYSLAKVAQFCMNASHASGGVSLHGSGPAMGQYTSGLVSAVERSLAIDPRQRPQSVAALRLLLLSTVAPPAPRPRQGAAGQPALALSDIPLSTIPFNEREALRLEPKPIGRERTFPSSRPQPEPALHRSRGARRAIPAPHTRRWPWAVAGALGTLGALVLAALVTVQVTGYQAPQLAGITLPRLPWLENLIERDPTAAGTMTADTPDTLPMPLQVEAPRTSTRPLAPAAVDIGRVTVPAAVAVKRESSVSVVVPAATASPAPDSDLSRRDAVPDNPAAACAPRTNFALYRCMQSQCEQQHFYAHSQCVRLRRYDELPA
jgi:non-specific serine/threonine protein kinase